MVQNHSSNNIIGSLGSKKIVCGVFFLLLHFVLRDYLSMYYDDDQMEQMVLLLIMHTHTNTQLINDLDLPKSKIFNTVDNFVTISFFFWVTIILVAIFQSSI